MQLLGLGAALTAAVLFGVGSIALAVAVRRVPDSAGLSAQVVMRLLREPPFLVAMASNLAGFGLHLIALRTIPLFLAQAGISASLAVTALLAVRVFGDHLGALDWAAVAGTGAGLVLLASATGEVGDESAGTAFTAGLFVALGALAVTGLVATRSPGSLATGLLGLLAGFGFAGVSIAARVLPGLSPSVLVAAPSAYALALSGCLAFALYSVALHRESVTRATAPMIVSQTVTPAVVGVLLLNDGIRSGWLPVAALGFAITGIGALTLARFEQTTEQPA